MIRFDKLILQGFKSFQDATEVNLDPRKGGGLYLILGKNLVEPKLGGNGVGKSSIWSGLCWVLYGKDQNGLRAGHVANWEQNEHLCSVVLHFSRGTSSYVLRRTWGPISLTLSVNGGEMKPVDQTRIDKLVGCGYELFLASVLMGQFNQLFFEISAAEKLRLFSDVLDLEGWVAAADHAKGVVEHLEASSKETSDALARNAGRLVELREQRDTIRDSLADPAERIKALSAELAVRSGELEGVDTAAKEVGDALKTFADRLDERERASAGLAEERASAIAELRNLEGQEVSLARELRRLEERMGEVEHADRCPWCKRSIDQAHTTRLLGMVGGEFEELRQRQKKCEAEQRKWKSARSANTTSLDLVLKEVDSLRAKLAELKDQARDLARKRSNLLMVRTRVEAELNAAKESHKSSSATLSSVKERIAATKQAIAELEESMQARHVESSRTAFWVNGFKDLRLWLIDAALAELEAYVNSALAELGLQGWSIRFSVERQSQSGSVVKGFQVFISPPESKEPVPWETYSGGERQRLKIAGAVGMASLIRARRGFWTTLEVWDEPTAHLSPEGVQSLVSYFAQRAAEEDRSIWLVENRPVDSGELTASVLVVRTKDGSQVYQGRRLTTYLIQEEK